MAGVTFLGNTVFPAGTTLGIYPASAVPPGHSGTPFGSQITSAVVGTGTTSVTGLEQGVRYAAGAQVDGSWRFIHFSADIDTSDTLPEHITRTEDVHGIPDSADLFSLSELDLDVTLAANSNTRVASQRAVKTYVDEVPFGGDGTVFVRTDETITYVRDLDPDPEAVTDWAPIIEAAYAAGARHFYFHDVSTDGSGTAYPLTTTLNALNTSCLLEGPGGRVDHYGNVLGLERMPAYLLWKGTGSTSAIACNTSVGWTARNLGIYYESELFTGTLIDWDGECAQAMLDSCDIGDPTAELTSPLALVTFENSWNSTIQNCNLRGAQWAILGDPTGGNFSDSLRVLNNYFANCSEAYLGAIGGGGNTEWSIDHNVFGMHNDNPAPQEWSTPRVIDMPATVDPNMTSYFTFTNNTVLDDPGGGGAWFRQKANNTWHATFSGNTIVRNADTGVFELLGGGHINIVDNPNLGTATAGGYIIDLGDTGAGAVAKSSVRILGNKWSLIDSNDVAILNAEFHKYVEIQSPNEETYTLDLRSLAGHERLAWYNDASQPRPSIVADAALGTGATALVIGTDIAGQIQLNPGSGATAGKQATITLGVPIPGSPDDTGRLHVILVPTDWDGGDGGVAVAAGAWTASTTGNTGVWEIWTDNIVTTTARFAYRVMGL